VAVHSFFEAANSFPYAFHDFRDLFATKEEYDDGQND
jgi:hypothetical protein